MFKKPLSSLKTSAPLRSSDRRKLKHRVLQAFPNIGDAELVPDGLLSVKFSTHLDEHGVAYLDPNGDPLWFTLGKGSEDLIPTVYTLWNKPDLLPVLTTPAAVIPVLVGGADLMIPGVVQLPGGNAPLHADQLVAIAQYHPAQAGAPLAVGRMALSGEEVRARGEKEEGEGRKGKAVLVLHTWKDCLWEMGAGGEVPAPRNVGGEAAEPEQGQGQAEVSGADEQGQGEVADEVGFEATLSPQEVTSTLRTTLLQSIATNLSKLPPGAWPITATIFYTTHILPFRPACPLSEATTSIDIKNSSHKSLTTFLKAAEKDGLVKLKELKAGKGTELVVMGVFPKHIDVEAHRGYATLKDVEDTRAKKEQRAEAERKKVKDMEVRECWKAWQGTVAFVEAAGGSTSTLYTMPELKTFINGYIAAHTLVNPNDQSYINLDALLRSTLTAKNNTEALEFMKRDDLTRRVVDKMQPWHEIAIDGKEPIVKKGTLKPISVVAKIRQGKKVSTLISGFEPFLITADVLAEELRRLCASATSVSPVQGKAAGMEVLVQGKQLDAVAGLLGARGVPKRWIEAVDLSSKKK
ncbi:hypothetical protein FIBSPDRAFT_873211 [Athelia psychrophila]|uniref:Eukaryotic translation initiation factor SUI1 family protein n=1 Tax=Athelia psychrophila TaxID=1759441 RepID=A0A165YRK3_9AGAM|nr:hypothetical protein FIBSPDRAFT_873211 [Fibularhizoctonia sp. CBS 109695]